MRLLNRLVLMLCTLVLLPALVGGSALALSPDPAVREAQAACVMDGEGRVLYARNEHEEMAPASITKVMTAMVALDAGIAPDELFEIQPTELVEVAQVVGYDVGEVVTFDNLMKATMVNSANDAALNLAFMVSGSVESFAELMNQKAAEIGLEHTHFMNPHGLEEPDHYSTAFDLCTMGRYALEHYPTIRELVHTPEIRIVAGGVEQTFYTTDELLGNYDGLRGIKTGRTESGTSFLSSARRGDVSLYTCALCCETLEGRFNDTRIMLDWGFDQYPERTLKQGGWVVRMAPWQDGFWMSCPVSLSHAVKAHPFVDEEINYSTIMSRQNARVAPGSTYGNTIWRQGEHYLSGVTYEAGRPTKAKAWNAFALPLFDGDEEHAA